MDAFSVVQLTVSKHGRQCIICSRRRLIDVNDYLIDDVDMFDAPHVMLWCVCISASSSGGGGMSKEEKKRLKLEQKKKEKIQRMTVCSVLAYLTASLFILGTVCLSMILCGLFTLVLCDFD